jgi:hypothetical protein
MSDIHELKVEFHGICAHFHGNVLPGIPHRVVIPDATPTRKGLVTMPLDGEGVPLDWLDYTLLPHDTTIRMKDHNFDRAGLVSNGVLFTRSALRIENTICKRIRYCDSFKQVPALTEFVKDFTPSVSTVLEGRAAAYFDFHSGVTFSSYKAGEEIRVVATVRTYGPPKLRITPFVAMSPPEDTKCYKLKSRCGEPLVIANLADTCQKKVEDYDFLLHYLTEKGGIPRALTNRAPGMPIPPGTTGEYGKGSDLGAGCSDSRYP